MAWHGGRLTRCKEERERERERERRVGVWKAETSDLLLVFGGGVLVVI